MSNTSFYKTWPLWYRCLTLFFVGLIDRIYSFWMEGCLVSSLWAESLLVCKTSIWTRWKKTMVEFCYRRCFESTKEFISFSTFTQNSSWDLKKYLKKMPKVVSTLPTKFYSQIYKMLQCNFMSKHSLISIKNLKAMLLLFCYILEFVMLKMVDFMVLVLIVPFLLFSSPCLPALLD